jgi:septal ring factor EnvC (AmiA/AmiB activator)
MNLRKIIREQISRVFQEEDMGINSAIGGTIGNIEDELANNLLGVNDVIGTQTIDLKNKDNEIKSNMQLKSKLDATSPHKKGLEREIPDAQKDYEKRKKQLKDLEDTKKGLEKAQGEIQKQRLELQKQTSKSSKGTKEAPASVLPSLGSPI